MKGNPKMIERLNARLSDELTAINQYIVHAEICENWGYSKLHDMAKKRAIDEMKHAEMHIARILFLEGMPIVSKLNAINIGKDIPLQHANDKVAEDTAVADYNEDIRFATEIGDNGTREMLESILKDEEAHLDQLEVHISQLEQLGVQHYLSEQRS